jgi:hypothetical protein
MFNWSSQNDDFGVSDGYHHKRVGIDPTGGSDPFAPTVVWGNEDRTMDVWVQLGVIAQAKGDAVTVFVQEKPEYSLKHNDVLIDDAALVTIPAPTGRVVQPEAVGSVKALVDNSTPDKALPISRIATTGMLPADKGEKYQYFKFEYAGGDLGYKINVLASPDDGNVLSNVGFRVYGPNQGKVYTKSGSQRGLTPNVTADLPATEPGTYVVQLYNANAGTNVEYKIWLTGKGLVGEAPVASPTAAPAPPTTAPVIAPVGPAVAPAPAGPLMPVQPSAPTEQPAAAADASATGPPGR